MTLNTPANRAAVVADLAKIAGISFTPEGADALASILGTVGQFEPGRAVTTRDEAGNEVCASDWLKATLSTYPAFVASKPAEKKPKTDTTGNGTTSAIAKVLAARSTEGKSKKAEELVAKFGNPYRTKNLSHQYFVQNFAPELAARLKMEA